jgi:ring-1,2-phenylacetyl-CoA epoxidase subunit PaaE
MTLFKKLFGKSDSKKPRGFQEATIGAVDKVTADTVRVTLDIPSNLDFSFVPGQYINFSLTIDGKEVRRSYSICSGKNEPLAVAVKQVENGLVSTWFNEKAKAGDIVLISKPEGNFVLSENDTNVVAIAAGSGITPILSIAKELNNKATLRLLYGNRTESGIIFKEEIDALNNVNVDYFLSAESKEGFKNGRITKEALTAIIKEDLNILKSDGFFICGPEEMIHETSEVLKNFGVSNSKIHFELFTTPTKTNGDQEQTETAIDTCEVTVIIDGEEESFEMKGSKNVLDASIDNGIDAPYSCKGGVCSSCKAKVIDGSVTMKLNYSLSDNEVAEGYILTCQSHPTSKNLTVNFDEE